MNGEFSFWSSWTDQAANVFFEHIAGIVAIISLLIKYRLV